MSSWALATTQHRLSCCRRGGPVGLSAALASCTQCCTATRLCRPGAGWRSGLLTPVSLACGECVLRLLDNVTALHGAQQHELESGAALQPKRCLVVLCHRQIQCQGIGPVIAIGVQQKLPAETGRHRDGWAEGSGWGTRQRNAAQPKTMTWRNLLQMLLPPSPGVAANLKGLRENPARASGESGQLPLQWQRTRGRQMPDNELLLTQCWLTRLRQTFCTPKNCLLTRLSGLTVCSPVSGLAAGGAATGAFSSTCRCIPRTRAAEQTSGW